MISGADDYPHPVPPQAFMTWKENWVFPAIDPRTRVASLFHFSLRPGLGEGIFSAKFAIGDFAHTYVGRSPVPADLPAFHPVADERLSFSVVDPGRSFRILYASDELDAAIDYEARFPAFDFEDGPPAPETSDLGEIGRHVFPFHHYEQALTHSGQILVKTGDLAGQRFDVSGYANRDHSWGWRDDFGFRYHHWLCASFSDRYVGGAMMREVHYPSGPKHGGFVASERGVDPVVEVRPPKSGWPTENMLLPDLRGDVTYDVVSTLGSVEQVTVHLDRRYGRLHLDARAPDRVRSYQDVLTFCDATLRSTGETGTAVLEIGTYLEGSELVEQARAQSRRRRAGAGAQ